LRRDRPRSKKRLRHLRAHREREAIRRIRPKIDKPDDIARVGGKERPATVAGINRRVRLHKAMARNPANRDGTVKAAN
jgi:hypothetical protein